MALVKKMRMRWAGQVECMGNELVKSDNLEDPAVASCKCTELIWIRRGTCCRVLQHKPKNFQVCRIYIVEKLLASQGLYSRWK